MAETANQLTREEVSKLVKKVKDWVPFRNEDNMCGYAGNLHVFMSLRGSIQPTGVHVAVESITRPLERSVILGEYNFEDKELISFYENARTNYNKEKAKREEEARANGLKEARQLLAQ